ncbi:type II toxin-antitoxin system RelE/ParE family toxin [Nannocystis pusilla]|uniref:type II toxin-antitoxin system RelE/ParE family toxin n=1 Tax=Nannocystis pusilla TaxID=889268 RepID=UPI003BF0B0B5
MHKLFFTLEARADLRGARSWCRTAYPNEYPRFCQIFADAFEEIAESPLRWAPWRAPDYRRRLLPPYPYAIVYHLAADHVLIDAILHQRQDPTRRFPP